MTVWDERRSDAATRLVPAVGRVSALDRLVELATGLTGAAAGQVSLTGEVQHVVAGAGPAWSDVGSTGPREDSLCTVTARGGRPLAVDDARTDKRVSHLPPVTGGAVGRYLGVPLHASTGEVVGALCVYDTDPHAWRSEDVTTLEQLAPAVVAELELLAVTAEFESARTVWELAVDAAGVGAWDWDLQTGELRWDHRLLELFGTTAEEFRGTIEAFSEYVHPDDRDRVSRALNHAIDTIGTYEAEYRVPLKDGSVRWISARGRALADETGTAVRAVGAAYDTTAVHEGEARLARLLESIPTAYFQLDLDWRVVYVNAEGERTLGAPREDLLGQVLWEAFPALVGTDQEVAYRASMASGAPASFDIPAPGEGARWHEVRTWPHPNGMLVHLLDVTARYEAAAQLELVATRESLAATLMAELAASEDIVHSVSQLAKHVVPTLADWCLVTVIDEDAPGSDWRRGLRDVGWAHADPAMAPVLDEYAALRMDALTDDSFLARGLRTAVPVVLERDATERVRGVLRPGRARDALAELAPASGLVMQMSARGKPAGLLSLFRGAGRAPFTAVDAHTVADLAGRAGLALETARVNATRRDLAEGLQRSLLTEPPTVPGLEIAVRYAPAAQLAQVGGDWYDAFPTGDGSTTIVIGDVVGHDTAAAAGMGQLRGILRGIAVHNDEGPAEVLTGVDAAIAALRLDTTATAVVARVTCRPDGSAALTWSNAGHPPPLLVEPGGTARLLASEEYDLLLGIDPASERGHHARTVAAGSTILLYTDGLVERRDRGLESGLAWLQAIAGQVLADHPDLGEACDALLARLRPDRPEDDAAVLAVRIG